MNKQSHIFFKWEIEFKCHLSGENPVLFPCYILPLLKLLIWFSKYLLNAWLSFLPCLLLDWLVVGTDWYKWQILPGSFTKEQDIFVHDFKWWCWSNNSKPRNKYPYYKFIKIYTLNYLKKLFDWYRYNFKAQNNCKWLRWNYPGARK